MLRILSRISAASGAEKRRFATQPASKQAKTNGKSKNIGQRSKPIAKKEPEQTEQLTTKKIEQAVMMSLISATRSTSEAQQIFGSISESVSEQKNVSESLMEPSTFETVKDLIDDTIEDGLEILAETVVSPLAAPLAEDIASIAELNADTMTQFFTSVCEKTIEKVDISKIHSDVAQTLPNASIDMEQVASAVDSIKSNGATSILGSSLSDQFFKESVATVIDAVAQDFARRAADHVALLAREIFEERLREELTKRAHQLIEDVHSGKEQTKKPSPSTEEQKNRQ